MLVMADLVRDVLANEVVCASNAAKAGVMPAVMKHLTNMSDILLSDRDFVYIDAPVWTQDMTVLAQEIARRRQ